MERKAQFRLAGNGVLSGNVEETYSGELASERRSLFRATQGVDRARHIENALAQFVDGRLEKAGLINLDHDGANLGAVFGVTYAFSAPDYAKRAGDLLLVRPRVLGNKTSRIPSGDRKYSIEFPTTSEETDGYEIALPPGYSVDELPPPVLIEFPFGEYSSRSEASGNMIRYQRRFLIRQVRIPPEELPRLLLFYRQIEADEHNSVVLRQRTSENEHH